MKMKIKVFCENKNGKIEFTAKELEELLNKTYIEGFMDCEETHAAVLTKEECDCNHECSHNCKCSCHDEEIEACDTSDNVSNKEDEVPLVPSHTSVPSSVLTDFTKEIFGLLGGF
jgi:hypothetical protein